MIDKKYAKINELRQFLFATDYKVIKEVETDYKMPQELKDERQSARDEINRLGQEVEQLKEDEQNEEIHHESISLR